jgi:pyruvate/2-oxoglutarate dehydrogenase complex dihydrolipoamide acyltransferase (E2) component
MIRLLGILTGATIAVGILIVIIGVPEFPEPEKTVELPPAAPGPAEPVPELQPAPAPLSTFEPAAEPVAEPVAEPASEPEPEPEPEPALEPVYEPDEPEAATDHWYAFWSPFRSELAANGFVAQLQRTTGLDYRVVKQEAGVYEVAFAYVDDADIEMKLEKISAATGLDVPEG